MIENHKKEIRLKLYIDACKSLSTHLTYQKYYIEGFRSIKNLKINISPIWLKLTSAAGMTGMNIIWKCLQSLRCRNLRSDADSVGKYIAETAAASQVKIAIDTADGRLIRDHEALEWCDIYFKANMWPSLRYPQKTLPLINGDGYLDKERLETLKKMRRANKSHDLIFWANIWEPRSQKDYSDETCRNIVEHQIKIFETLAKSKCNKTLLAIFPEKKSTRTLKNTEEFILRLTSAGVKCQIGWGIIDSRTFWKNLAESNIVFMRPGNHLCISWRLIGLLCLGSCVVYDNAPFPQWYEPLVAESHYVDGNCGLGPDYSLPDEARYDNILSSIENLLVKDKKLQEFKANAADYYDNFGSPVAVAKYILKSACRIT